MEIGIIVIFFVGVLLFDFLPSVKNFEKKTIWIYSILFILTLTLLIIDNITHNVPSLTMGITEIVKRIIGE